MSIEFKYTILSTDVDARCMEVRYEAEGHPPMNIGARLPYEGEPLEEIIKMYAPIAFWESLQAVVVAPAVGTEGVITPQEPANHATLEAQETLPKVVL